MRFFKFICIIWLLFGTFLILSDLKHNYGNYKMLIPLSLDERRAVTTGRDFYKFLTFCDRAIPQGKAIKWIFAEGTLWEIRYLEFRANYYLYPRSYRDNACYIIVYNRQDYKAPPGYRLLCIYGENKYILLKEAD